MERIDRLETKVREMIAMVHSLREENGQLKSQVAEYETRLSGLSDEQGMIDEERNQLRDRIESMLADLEALEAGATPPAEDTDNTTPDDAPAMEAEAFQPEAAPEVTPESASEESGGFTLEPSPEPFSNTPPADAPDLPMENTLDAGAQEIDLPEPDATTPSNDDEGDPPAPPGSDPAHPVLPGFS